MREKGFRTWSRPLVGLQASSRPASFPRPGVSQTFSVICHTVKVLGFEGIVAIEVNVRMWAWCFSETVYKTGPGVGRLALGSLV